MATLVPTRRKETTSRFLETPFSRLPSLFSDWTDSGERLGLFNRLDAFNVSMYEENNGKELIVEVPMPGLNANDINVDLKQGVLWIRGAHKQEDQSKKKGRRYYRHTSRSYAVQVPLPTRIADDTGTLSADYENGIIKISLPLAPAEEGSTPIAVKSKKKNHR